MRKSVYTRPDKPMFVAVQRRTSPTLPQAPEIAEPLVIDKASECHITPSDVARRMVDYLGPAGDYATLEPSAGTGALVSALLASGHSKGEITAVERHHKLAAKVATLGVPVIEECFLGYAERVRGKVAFPRIVMNPPFSKVRRHIKAALTLLDAGGHREPANLVGVRTRFAPVDTLRANGL
ncbi:methyltransferase type 11 [Roseibium sp. TrichSKD4]|uniref:type 11 methyltransferase n=1 Tax=Roseibium sp. TrichSKD4 TaxID=744980 RepID=UPI0001E56A76|nr:type 11 methyltransferase [Roseibium sp. TrichSKD4]EFO31906.1 methyltransferase type 11 [Roseibium sp. TrichSKD4]